MDELTVRKLVDEDGNEIEAITLEDFNAQKEILEQKIAEIEEKYAGEKDKEKNFKAIKEKEKKVLSEKEELLAKISELNETVNNFKKERIDEIKGRYLKRYAGDNEDDQKKLLAEYELIAKDADSEEQIQMAFEKAAKLTELSSNEDSFYEGIRSNVGETPMRKEIDFSETEQGKQFAAELGLAQAKKNDNNEEK